MNNPNNQNSNSVLIALFIAVLVDMLGVGIVIAVLVDYIKESPNLLINFTQGKTAEQIKNLENFVYLGLISAFALSQFFGGSILGALSDAQGRKKVSIYSMIGGAIGYFIFPFGVIQANIYILFLGRIITGFFSGSVSILYSIVADISSPEKKSQNFGILGAAFGLGFIVGPLFGSILADSSKVAWFNYSTPFFTAMFLSLASALLIRLFVPETYKTADLDSSKKVNLNPLQGLKNIRKALAVKDLPIILTILFLVYFGFTFFTQYSAVYLKDKMGIQSQEIGYYFGSIGLILFITQMGINRLLSKKLKPRNILRIALFTMPLGISLFMFPKEFQHIFYIIFLMPISFGLFQPNMLSIISNSASKDIQGEILGIQQSVRSLAYIFPPILAAQLSSIPQKYIPFNIPSANIPLIFGVVVVLIAWALVNINFKRLDK